MLKARASRALECLTTDVPVIMSPNAFVACLPVVLVLAIVPCLVFAQDEEVSQEKRYDGYKLYRFVPIDDAHVAILSYIENDTSGDVS